MSRHLRVRVEEVEKHTEDLKHLSCFSDHAYTVWRLAEAVTRALSDIVKELEQRK